MKILGLLSFILLLTDCEKFKDRVLDPAFLQVESLQVISAAHQPLRNSVRDIWVYIDDYYYGTFTPPFSIPVLESGKRNVKLYPGIRYYGILSKPEIYTMMNEFTESVEFKAGQTITLTPAFSYKSNIIIGFDESFELGNSFNNDLDSLPETKIVRSEANPSEGNYSGQVHLTSQNNKIEVSSTAFTVAQKKNVFLEMDIKSDINLSVGLSINRTGPFYYFFTIKPIADWKKIYIPIFEIIGEETSNSFQLALKSELPVGLSAGSFSIDNIRIISLP
ncbi:MAG: hypothetical protein ABI844_01205 [Saprospiraceae bacterium]